MSDVWISPCKRMELRLGKWQDVLSDVTECDAVITDPPYGERTHKGHDAAALGHLGSGHDGADRQALDYSFLRPGDVAEFVDRWTVASGWFVAFTDHELSVAWLDSMRRVSRYTFAPLPYVARGSRCRMGGDGPSSWAVWICVSRTAAQSKWGTLPGAYACTGDRFITGGKPLQLMQDVVRDYSRPGDLIVDPCAGGGTTLLAAAIEGRRAIGAEMDPETYRKAVKRLSAGYTPSMWSGTKTKQKQEAMF